GSNRELFPVERWAACHAVALCEGGFGVEFRRFPRAGADDLHLIPQPLLVAMRPHAFAALVLGNFCFPSFFKRAHLDFQTSQVAIQPSNRLHCNSVSLVSAVITEIVGRLSQTPTLYCSTLLNLLT